VLPVVTLAEQKSWLSNLHMLICSPGVWLPKNSSFVIAISFRHFSCAIPNQSRCNFQHPIVLASWNGHSGALPWWLVAMQFLIILMFIGVGQLWVYIGFTPCQIDLSNLVCLELLVNSEIKCSESFMAVQHHILLWSHRSSVIICMWCVYRRRLVAKSLPSETAIEKLPFANYEYKYVCIVFVWRTPFLSLHVNV